MNSRRCLILTIAGAVFSFAFFFFVFYRFTLINEFSDHLSHIQYAEDVYSKQSITSPHFLLQIILVAMRVVLVGFSHELNSAIVLALCYALLFLFLAWVRRDSHPGKDCIPVLVLIFLTLISAHIFIATLFVPNFYANYLAPLTFHNPTQQLNKLFAALIWLVFFLKFHGHRPESMSTIAALSILCVLSALAKPSFLIAFLPIVGLIFIKEVFVLGGRRLLAYALAFGPVALTLVWQFSFAYAGDGGRGIVVAPFAVFSDPAQYVLTLPLSLLFPIVCAFALREEARSSDAFKWAWVFMGIALFYALFLAEAVDVGSGNFAWTAQTGAFLLHVQALMLVFDAAAKKGSWPKAPLVALAVHALFGLILAGASAFWRWEQWT